MVGAEAIRLHFALDDVEGVAREPERLPRQAAVEGNLPGGDLLAVDAVTGSVTVHEVLEGGEPGPVGGGLAVDGDGGAAVDASEEALVRAELADAVPGPGVEARIAVRLALQADADVLYGRRQRRVGDAREGARGKVLSVTQAVRLEARVGGVASLEPPAGGVEGTELDGDAGADAQQRREGSLVEGEGALVSVDGGGGVHRARVLVGGLKSDLDNVKGLACRWDSQRLRLWDRSCLPWFFFKAVRRFVRIDAAGPFWRRAQLHDSAQSWLQRDTYRSGPVQLLPRHLRTGPWRSAALRPASPRLRLQPLRMAATAPIGERRVSAAAKTREPSPNSIDTVANPARRYGWAN